MIFEYEGAYVGVHSPHQQPGIRAYGADNRLLMLGYVHEWFHVSHAGGCPLRRSNSHTRRWCCRHRLRDPC